MDKELTTLGDFQVEFFEEDMNKPIEWLFEKLIELQKKVEELENKTTN